MKKLLAILAVLVIALPGYSQVKVGLKAGVSTNTVPSYDISTGTSTIEALKDASYGIHGGLFLRFSLAGVYVQPEVLFSSTEFEYTVKTASNLDGAVKSHKFNKLDIPVLFGFNLGPVRLNAGPSASILINSPEALIDSPDFEEMYKSATFGYQAGVGVDFLKRFTLDLRYEGSLSKKFGDAVSIGSQTFNLDSRQSALHLSLGVVF
jgi:opacity protein-like surface antigen